MAVDRPLGGRDDLLRHSRLLDRMVMDAPVLPMRFGAVPADADAVVAELLAPHHDEFAQELAAPAGTAQFTVRVRYVEEAVLREVIAEEPRIARLSAASRDRPAKGGHQEQLRLGELVASAVDRKRADDTAILTDALAPYAVAVAPSRPWSQTAWPTWPRRWSSVDSAAASSRRSTTSLNAGRTRVGRGRSARSHPMTSPASCRGRPDRGVVGRLAGADRAGSRGDLAGREAGGDQACDPALISRELKEIQRAARQVSCLSTRAGS